MPPDRLLIYFFIAIIMLLLNKLCTSINLSFSRIKKNQIEKDENDKFYYKKTSAVLAAT